MKISNRLSLRQKLKQNQLMIGTLLTLPSPEIAELLSLTGLDWFFLDMEHGLLGIQDVQRAIQAAGWRCYTVVRSPASDEVWLKRILDTGADGILIPRVNSVSETQIIINNCKFPPEGRRSVGIARAHGYGKHFSSYLSSANDEIAVIIQIEDIAGVGEIEDIVQVKGVDAVFLGPYDLSGSMGKPGRVKDADVLEQLEKVRTACRNAEIPIGIFGIDAETLKPYIAQGYTLNAVGMDAGLLQNTVQGIVDELRT